MKRQEIGDYYRNHLLNEVMPFWEVRTRDEECGGYLTCFDRQGNVTDRTKYVWFQARQLYMFSALYNQMEPSSKWLDLAKHGRDFLVAHAYAGDGRWQYQLDRNGAVEKGTISIYTDMFLLQGLSEYAVASGSDEDRTLIEETMAGIEKNVTDPEFKDIFHGTWNPRYKRHGIHMISINTADVVSQVLGRDRTRSLIDYCIHAVLFEFAKDEFEALFESIGRDGAIIDDEEGRILDPGHALESAWFCIAEGRLRGDQTIIDRAIQVAEWTYRRGHDGEHGGVFAFLDASGKEPRQRDWHKEANMMWHDKCWWANSEALYTLALCAVQTGDTTWWNRFEKLHTFCREHFYDPEFGEWYPELYRDGSVKLSDKGTLWKAAYHLPRSLMQIALLFENHE